MSNKRALFSSLKIAAFLLVLLFFGCANRQLPQGGPKDHDPPKLLKATPPDMTRNFKGKVIKLEFDEFFKLTNQFSEITMSPTPAKTPDYKRSQKTLVITLKDSLEKNTTYVINFGKAIADVTEGNILKNFTYVFSTGPHIDSLSISGNVINTMTGLKEKDATVMLFTLKQDSLLFGKKRPTIFTTTDTAGNFTLNNLHADAYRIYALKESTGANKIYDNDKELIAFDKNVLHLTRDTSDIELKLFQARPEKFRPVANFDADGKITAIFNRPVENPAITIVYPKDFDKYKIVEFSKTKDTATLYMRNMNFDSLSMVFSENGKPLDTVYKKKQLKESFVRFLNFRFNINSNNHLKPGTDLIIKSSYPIDTFDPSLISLKEDSTDITNFTIQRDSLDTRLFKLINHWRQGPTYTLTIGENAFTDIYGEKNKRQPLKKFDIDKPENYSQLTLTVTVPDTSKQYIVELLDDHKDVLREDIITKNSSIIYKNYITAKYGVRVIYDDNKNDRWDSGSVKRRTQPENIWNDPDVITLRPNWEQQTAVTIPREPTSQ